MSNFAMKNYCKIRHFVLFHNKSEFIKNAYRHNKVRDLKEAFEEYPVEEEWHEVESRKCINGFN